MNNKIYKFELVKIDFIVRLTNSYLEFQSDSSIREKLIKNIEHEIGVIKYNKFENEEGNPVYKEFNQIIDNCIALLKDKIERIKCNKKCEQFIEFDPADYEELVFKGI